MSGDYPIEPRQDDEETLSEPRHEEHQPHRPPPDAPDTQVDPVPPAPAEGELIDPLAESTLTAEEEAEIMEAVTVEAEIVQPPPLELYRCRLGHEQLGAHEAVATSTQPNDRGKVIAKSGAVCIACQLGWFGQKFRTHKVPARAS